LGTGGRFLRKLRARVTDEPTGFAWVEDGKLAASGYPASKGQLEWAIAHHIDTVLTLTPEPLPEQSVAGLPLKLVHLPMRDHAVPSVETLGKGAEIVSDNLREGRSVLVHCLAGEGRTGCVLAAYLMRDKGLTAAEALRTLRAIKPRFVEPAQEKALSEYEASR
jgi:atypical dual specificity phosphatase